MTWQTKRDALVALSFGNLAYFQIWTALLTYRRPDTFLMKAPPDPGEYTATLASVLLVATSLWLAVTGARRYLTPIGFRWVRVAFLLALALPAYAVRVVLVKHFDLVALTLTSLIPRSGAIPALVCLGGVLLATLVLKHLLASHIAASALVCFVPLVPITFAEAAWRVAHYDDREFRVALAPPIPNARRLPRVLWVICDEWDYHLSFVSRDPTLQLPNIDRLRSQVMFASDAHPPGKSTKISVPGYLTGRLVKSVEFEGPGTIEVSFRESDRPVSLVDTPSVFKQARALGANTAVVGWYLPYSRLFHSDLVLSNWWPRSPQYNSWGRVFWSALPRQLESFSDSPAFSPFGQTLAVRDHVRTYQVMLARAKYVANDRDLQFIYIHLPVPHGPHAYDRRTGRFDSRDVVHGYTDSLALLDLTLGQLREFMERGGTWNDTTVVITTDHPYRQQIEVTGTSDPRIPYFLKLAGQREGWAYDAAFNTVLTQSLLLAVMRGEVADVESAVRWLDSNRLRAPLD